jgi:hypothetical protein
MGYLIIRPLTREWKRHHEYIYIIRSFGKGECQEERISERGKITIMSKISLSSFEHSKVVL